MHLHAPALAQSNVPFEAGRIAPLKDGGRGFLIEDFDYFRDRVLDSIAVRDSLALADPRSEARVKAADSLFGLLQTKGLLALAKEDLSLVSLFPLGAEEPRVLANLLFTLNRLGGTKSLTYAVKLGDTLDIRYRISKGHGWDEFEVVEGTEVRFTASRNAKNKDIVAQIVAQADGIVTVNMVNKGVLRSKGQFTLTRRSAKRNLALRYVCDTLYDEVKVTRKVVDTVAEPLFSRLVGLSSTRDITRSSSVSFNLPFTTGRDYLAWGFWIGSKDESRQAWEGVAAEQPDGDPLTRYILKEMRMDDFFLLPEEDNPDIRFTIGQPGGAVLRDAKGRYAASAALSPTPNSRSNYGAVLVRRRSKAKAAVQMRIENLSKVYGYQALVNVVGIYADTHEEEAVDMRKKCVEFVMLTFS